ncbi:CRISPR-associated helicase Cas3' [Streptomyces sp. NPDC050560]|uniref:CRISPR-associated helicase Cas3' n=1 Tax=Streptomyces sp. NPDC050560 TaxID=3365630 RepID=UPI0037909090
MDVEKIRARYGPEVAAALGTVWGKSKERAGGRTNLLLTHLLDTAAVAELLWDRFLAPSVRDAVDRVAGGPGRGRLFFMWLCGVHDCGKATPAHQRIWPEGGEAVRRVGLTWVEAAAAAGAKRSRWRHDWAGGLLVRESLRSAGWKAEQVDWAWPLVAGHHGMFPTLSNIQEPPFAKGQLRGRRLWRELQDAVLVEFTAEVGLAGLESTQPAVAPPRALQLVLSGFMVMADWIASDEKYFVGVDDLTRVSLDNARERAAKAWAELELRGGWGRLATPGSSAFRVRFGKRPRISQTMVTEAAWRMRSPGLLVVEAPMGEGKTEAALAAVEVLAARFGADGLFVGMPTQATCDPMFTRVRQWAEAIDPRLAAEVALLHGKRAFNKEWRALLGGSPDTSDRFAGVDEYGCEDDPYGLQGNRADQDRLAPAEWFLGSKRGLLASFAVGTVDQLLYAATRTRHVMLRMAGLAGKVVVLDEVHACDVYMSQFLQEALRWLGQARIPVVLLSATLPPASRHALVEAYLAGAASREEFPVTVPAPGGYPQVTTAWIEEETGKPRFHSAAAKGWRGDLPVRVTVVPESIPGPRASLRDRDARRAAADTAVVRLLEHELAQGGTALVIRNTVDRAQSLYDSVQARFGSARVRLLHAQFTVSERADLTQDCLHLLGPDRPASRGETTIIIATQLAEQSFDVDADLLITDLAPIDLLLQRIGRLHRHADTWRPAPLREPQVFVTGFQPRGAREPAFSYADTKIYGTHLMLRAAALLPVQAGDLAGTAAPAPDTLAGARIWQVPSVVPSLVKQAYDDDPSLLPEAWRAAGEAAAEEHRGEQRVRAETARELLLTRHGEHELPTLAGLHYGGASSGDSEDQMRVAVRDGDESVEVILVVQEAEGEPYRTLGGRPLSANGDVAAELLDEVLGSAVRLPVSLTRDAQSLSPLAAWHGHPWLHHSRALVLDASQRALLGSVELRYEKKAGLRKKRLA